MQTSWGLKIMRRPKIPPMLMVGQMSTSRGTWRRACRCPRSKDPKGVALFGRVVGAPSDRNLIDFYADGGITFSGMIPRRPDDSLAIGVAYTGISDQSAPSTSTPPFLWRAITRRCLRSATPHSLPLAGRCSQISSTSGSPAAICRMTRATGPFQMRLCLGHVRL